MVANPKNNRRRLYSRLTLLSLALHFRADAAVFYVTDTSDSLRTTSLRGAIIAAGQSSAHLFSRSFVNTIILASPPRYHVVGPQIYHLSLAGSDGTNSRTGQLNINFGALTILATGSNVVIDATGLGDRLFTIAPAAFLNLQNLTLRGGSAPTAPGLWGGGEFGGAIFNAGYLTLKNCILTNNSSGPGGYVEGNGGGTQGGDGGAIYNSGTMYLAGCSIRGNSAGAGFDGASGGNGGGIRNEGLATLVQCTVSGNQSGPGGGPAGNGGGWGGNGGDGGGIYNSGSLILTDCTIGENLTSPGIGGGDPSGFIGIGAPGGWGGSGGQGGGIYNSGTLQFNFSSLCGNICGDGGDGGSFGSGGGAGAGGNGGGLFNRGNASLNTSTVANNFCGHGGNGGSGYFYNGAGGGSGGSGGGIYDAGQLTANSCTIASNQTGMGGNGGDANRLFIAVPAATGGPGGSGGGIFTTTNALLQNTLVAQNRISLGGAGGTNVVLNFSWPPPDTIIPGTNGPAGTGSDLSGSFTSHGFNLISTADGSTGVVNGLNADQAGTDISTINPLLGPLQMNGGPTPTLALLTGSPAIDQGNSFDLHFDQRGDKRPFRFHNLTKPAGGDGTDIGAYELIPGH